MSCKFRNDHSNDEEWVALPNGAFITRKVYRNWIHYKYNKRHKSKQEKPHRLEHLLLGIPYVTRKRIQKITRKLK